MTDGERPGSRADDRACMRRALALAARGWGQTAPNPMVGAVVVRDGVVVGEGWHARLGGPHAEVEALRAAGERARGATLYVTLEPCASPRQDAAVHRRAPRRRRARAWSLPCADPSPVAGGGADAPARRRASRSTSASRRRPRASSTRPSSTRSSSDAAVRARSSSRCRSTARSPMHSRQPRWLTGELARREVHRLRAGSDAIAVGIGTVLADDPELTVRARAAAARRADARRLRHVARGCRSTSQLVRDRAQTPDHRRVLGARAARTRAALEPPASRCFTPPRSRDALVALRERGVRSLLVEGGARARRPLRPGGARRPPDYLSGTPRARRGALNAFARRAGTSRADDAPALAARPTRDASATT